MICHQEKSSPLWHSKVWEQFENVKLILLIGKYSQDQYLGKLSKKNLTENIMHYEEYLPKFFLLPHPSPVNHFWHRKNPWFEEDIVEVLQDLVAEIL